MENPKLNSENTIFGLESLAQQLPGTVIAGDGSATLKLFSPVGTGYIKFQKLQKGIEIFNFYITLTEDKEIFIENLSNEKLNFFYCLEGACTYVLYPNHGKVNIDQFQSAVTFQKNKQTRSLLVQRNTKLALNIISINQELYFKKFQIPNEKHNDQLCKILKEIGEKDNFAHLGGFSLKIAEQLKKLFHDDGNTIDISDKLSEKGSYYIVLAQQMEQFYREIQNKNTTNTLSKSEILKIVEISDFIKKAPEAPHHIKTLCRKTTLSPAKLQEGFKYMFNRTVSDYVRFVRLEKATRLLLETDLTISEIVYTVGLTSRSYFCKIFKEKYKCSPKVYRKRK